MIAWTRTAPVRSVKARKRVKMNPSSHSNLLCLCKTYSMKWMKAHLPFVLKPNTFATDNKPSQKKSSQRIVSQSPFFRGKLLVLGYVDSKDCEISCVSPSHFQSTQRIQSLLSMIGGVQSPPSAYSFLRCPTIPRRWARIPSYPMILVERLGSPGMMYFPH